MLKRSDMVDTTLIEILGVVITMFFGGIITLMIHFANGIKDDISDLDEKMEKKMSAGFAQVDKRFDQVDQRIDRVDQRIDKVDQRIDGVDQRINGLILHLVPKPIPGVVQAAHEPPATPEPEVAPGPELLTGTD